MENGQQTQVAERIENALPLVKHVMYQVAVRFPRHVDKDELISAGVMGLVQAAHRYDASKGASFNHYAARRIRGAILDALRATDWAPRSLRRAGRSLDEAGNRLANELHRSPTAAELAEELGISPAGLAELRHRLAQSVVLGLEAVISDADSDDSEIALGSALADPRPGPEDRLLDGELHAELRRSVDLLPDRHRCVIRGYFFEGRSSVELADELGVTVSRVSQLRTEAFGIIRARLEAPAAA